MTWKTAFVADGGRLWRLHVAADVDPARLATARTRPALHETGHSRIVEWDAARHIALKLTRPRTLPRDVLRKYVSSEAHREAAAAPVLARLGIAAQEVLGYGVTLNPFADFASCLFFRYRGDVTRGTEFLIGSTDAPARRRVLAAIARDIGTLYRSGHHHKDFHFGNVLVADGAPFWIDCDVRRASGAALQRGLDGTLARLRKHYPILRDDEQALLEAEFARLRQDLQQPRVEAP